jgi:hypothetical protein
MTALAIHTADAVLDLLDKEACAVNMTGLVQLLPDHDQAEIKRLTNDLYMKGRISRLSVMGATGRYYVFFSLAIRTARGATVRVLEEQASPLELVVVPPTPLSPEQAVEVLERGGWKAEPEVVEPVQVERRAPDRRRLTVLDVVKRWRLAYPLGRVVEIIAESRRGGLSRDNAALAIRMIREQVRNDE